MFADRTCVLSLVLLSQTSLTLSEVVNVTLDDYVIVLDDESPSSFQNASQWCEYHLSSSLASFHTLDQLDGVLDEISRNMSDVFSGDRYFWYGERCEWQDWGFNKDGVSYNRTITRSSNRDGTQFDLILEQSSEVNVSELWSRSTNCTDALALQYDEEQDHFVLHSQLDVVGQTQAFICNAHTDAAWQSLNPARSDFLQCNGTGLGRECILDCTVNQQCMYLNHSLIQGVHSLDVICENIDSCKGMTLRIEDVSEVTLLSNADRAFQSGIVMVSGMDSVSFKVSGSEGAESAYLFASDISVLEMESLSDKGLARSTVVAQSIDDYVSLFCDSFIGSCSNITTDLDRVWNVTVFVKTHPLEPTMLGGRFLLSNIENINVTCLSRSAYTDGCHESIFEVQRAQHFGLTCQGLLGPCIRNTLQLALTRHIEIVCFGFYSCAQMRWVPGLETDDTDLDITCFSTFGCNFDWGWRIPLRVATEAEQMNSVTSDCEGAVSCHNTFFHEDYYGYDTNLSLIRNSFSVRCDGWRKPCGQGPSSMFSLLGFISAPEITLHCVDQGCDGIVVNLSPMISSATLICEATGKFIPTCVEMEWNGYCVEDSLHVLIEEDTTVPDMQVACPDSAGESCTVRVKKGGVMDRGSIAMLDKIWKKAEYKLKGNQHAFEVVSSRRISKDSECDALDSETRCFIVKGSDKNRWFESNSCEEFVPSLYSPFTTITLSGTGLIGSVFLFAAINLSRPDWRVNGLLCCFFLMCVSTLIGSLQLESVEASAKSSLDDDSDLDISTDGFAYWAALSGFCFALFISACEVWYIHSDREKRPLRLTVIHHGSGKGREKRLKTTLVLICNVRMLEMLLIYLVRYYTDFSLMLTLFVFISLDLLFICVPRSLRVSLLITSAVWVLMSNYSPLWLLIPFNAEPSFFSVVVASSASGVLIWFDFVLIQLAFGLSVLIMISDGNGLRFKVYMMFVQFLDFVTDWMVVTFWFRGGFIFWAVMELIFLGTAGGIGWLSVFKQLDHWYEHVIIWCGLGRGLTKIRMWDEVNHEWAAIDRSISRMETFYESYPSVFLGFYLVISDDYYSELTDSPSGGTANLGPLIVSVAITALSVTNKTIIRTRKRIVKNRSISVLSQCWLILVVCLFIISDFIVRCVPLCYLLAIAQNDNLNIWAAPAMIGVGLTVIVVGMAEQAAGIRFASVMDDGAWKSEALFSAFPSIMSCSPMFFGCFSDPRLFDYGRFFTVHWATLVQSTAIAALCLLIHGSIQAGSFAFPYYAAFFFFFLIINLITGLTIQFYYRSIFEWID